MAKTKKQIVSDSEYLTGDEKLVMSKLNSCRMTKFTEKTSLQRAMKVVMALPQDVDEEVLSRFLTRSELLAYKAYKSALDDPLLGIEKISKAMGEDKITVSHDVESGTDLFIGFSSCPKDDGDSESC